jgi:hypothetical protein
MLSMCKNSLLVGWECVEIGYSLTEHARKVVTLWLTTRGNWLLVGWSYEESCFYCIEPCFSPVHFSRPLSNVLCLLSQVSFPCLLVRVEEFFPMKQGAIRYLNDEKKDNLLNVASCWKWNHQTFPESREAVRQSWEGVRSRQVNSTWHWQHIG